MPREEMRDRMRAAYAEETRIAQEKVKRAGIDREATAAGRAEGERAASRMGVDTPFEMAMAAPAIGMAQQSGGRPVYDREGIVLPDEAAGLSALNSAGFFIPGMVNQRFGERLEEGRRQEPGFALAGDVAGGMIPGELIGHGIAQVGKMVAPQFARLGSMLKGDLVLGPERAVDPAKIEAAREAGFNTDSVLFRGLRKPIEGDEFYGSTTPGYELQGMGVSLSEDASKAAQYGDNVYPAMVRGKMFSEKEYLNRVRALVAGGMDARRAGGKVRSELEKEGYAALKADGGGLLDEGEVRVWENFDGPPNVRPVNPSPLLLGPESRIRPIDRPDAFPGDDVLTAKALDQWTPPPEQQVRPMGFFGGKKPPAERTQDTIGREIKDIEKQLRRKGYTLNEAETLAEKGMLPPELRGLMIQHGDLVRESGRVQGAARTAKGGVETDPEYLRAESEMNKAADDVANAEYEIARELRDRGLNWEGDDAEFMGVVDQLRREGKLSNYLASRVEDLRAASTRMFDAEAKMKSRVKSFGLLTERGRDAVEQTFGAAYMSGTGSVAGGQYDLNGDGKIDNADLAIGSGIGLAAFASPLALRKVAELGGRLKGTKPQGMTPEAPRTPQQAAKFETPGSPEYEAAKAKGLDMSQAGRMARAKEMGFDTETVLYHGTPDARPIEASGQFEKRNQYASYLSDPDRYQQIQAEMAAERAANGVSEKYMALLDEAQKLNVDAKAPRPIYMSNSSATAKTYARDDRAFDYQGAEPKVMPLYVRGNMLKLDAGGLRFSMLPINVVRRGIPQERLAEFDRLVARYSRDLTGNDGRMSTADIELIASDMGYDGFTIRNIVDDYQGKGGKSTVTAVFDPSNIRSVNAAFDPDKAASPILTAGVGGKR
jgi:hypothetical protein